MVYYIVVVLAWIVFRIGFRVKCIGKENLIKGRGYILAPNHLSAIDPVFVVICKDWWHQMRVFSKGELFDGKAALRWFLYQIGCVPVKKGRDDLDTIARTVEEMKGGKGLLMFPEGTRSKTGEVLPLKSGLFVVAAQAGVDVVPCRIIYDTPDGSMKLFCRVRVCYGQPIPAEAFAQKGEKRDRNQLKENKARFLAAWEELYQKNKFH
ncbi:MAG: lysophospholipid acyltransferase family protein [Faecalibacterium sp.]